MYILAAVLDIIRCNLYEICGSTVKDAIESDISCV
jgi:hypothetical protein